MAFRNESRQWHWGRNGAAPENKKHCSPNPIHHDDGIVCHKYGDHQATSVRGQIASLPDPHNFCDKKYSNIWDCRVIFFGFALLHSIPFLASLFGTTPSSIINNRRSQLNDDG
mmetsp:Transcript_2186/g.5571  ORF Transcript_2186/g.5571 Transcript_2186/m.5571 type:complete len:113 (-) Transcript_2186:67-405(-)